MVGGRESHATPQYGSVRVVDRLPTTKDSAHTNFRDITVRLVQSRIVVRACLRARQVPPFPGRNAGTSAWSQHRVLKTFYPINPQRKIGVGYSDNNQGDDMVLSSSSFHPGGANFAFADGSVHFLKDSIQSWQLNVNGQTFIPAGFMRDSNGTFSSTGVNGQLGVYQKLSTRNGGDVISSDSY